MCNKHDVKRITEKVKGHTGVRRDEYRRKPYTYIRKSSVREYMCISGNISGGFESSTLVPLVKL